MKTFCLMLNYIDLICFIEIINFHKVTLGKLKCHTHNSPLRELFSDFVDNTGYLVPGLGLLPSAPGLCLGHGPEDAQEGGHEPLDDPALGVQTEQSKGLSIRISRRHSISHHSVSPVYSRGR